MPRKKTYIENLKKDRHYGMIANKLFDIGLSVNAIAVFTYLVCQSNNFNPSQKMITEKVGLSDQKAIRKALEELKQKNMISVTRRGKHFYTIQPANKWRIPPLNEEKSSYNAGSKSPTIQEEQEENTKVLVIRETEEQRLSRIIEEARTRSNNPLYIKAHGSTEKAYRTLLEQQLGHELAASILKKESNNDECA